MPGRTQDVRTTSPLHIFLGDGPGFATRATMSWIILFLAGLFEVLWAVGLKTTAGFTRLWPTLGTLAAMIISLLLLGLAMRDLPVGTAYAVWTGIGALGTAVVGIVCFGDPATAGRLLSLLCILVGIVGLKLAS